MSIKLKPLHDKIIVKRLESEKTTAGGIIIPDSAKEKPIEGIVVAVGDGTTDINGKKNALTVKENDVVLFAKWGGTEVKIDGQEYLIMKESDILAIKL